MYCTNCGSKLSEDVNFCSKCGKELVKQKPMYCTTCGGKLNPRNGKCMRCLMKQRNNPINDESVIVKHKSNENTKLNIFFNLGVVMVLIAGFVLATTNWQNITNWGKIGILIILSIFFMLMHLFCEKKLKIKVSAYVYWLLSMAFILFTGISLTYLEMFGHWFSLAGPGKFLCLASLSLLFSLLMLATRLKYKKKWISLFIFVGIILFIFFTCRHFGLGWLSNLAVISLLMLLLYLYSEKSNYKYITITLGLIIIFLEGLFVLIIRPDYNIIAGTILIVCNTLLLFIFGYLQKNKAIKILSAVILFSFFLARLRSVKRAIKD